MEIMLTLFGHSCQLQTLSGLRDIASEASERQKASYLTVAPKQYKADNPKAPK